MDELLVSVIMPTYNRGNIIKRAVDSVLNQTYGCLELIIVDDGSTDNTVDVVKTYKDDRIRLICQEHGGANRARNIGIASARGKYIAFQDSDDEWHANKLAVQVAFMKEKGYLACFSPYCLYEGGSMCVIPWDYQTNEGYYNDLINILKCYNVVGTPTLFLDKKVISLLGGEVFDEMLPRLQDYELLIRLIQLVEIGYVEEPLVSAYRDGGNIFENRRNLYKAVGRILEKHKEFLDVKLFLDAYIIKDAEYVDIRQLTEGIRIVGDTAGAELETLNMGLIEYLYDRISYRNTVLEKLYQAKMESLHNRRFVIYGTGDVAGKFYKMVRETGIRPECFIVTFIKENESETIDGIPVKRAEEYESRGLLVVVCVSEQYQADILDNLIRLGYSDICIYHAYQGRK